MKALKGIGIFNIILGVIAFIAPLKFYSIASKLFTPETSPPFSIGAVQTTTSLLFIPGIVLVVNGFALIVLGYKLQHVPEIKAFTESGGYLGEVKGVGMEKGELESVEVGGEEHEVYSKEQMTAVDDVVLVKEEKEEPQGEVTQHEIVGKEVYGVEGEYYGKIESVTLDEKGNVLEFMAVRGSDRKVIASSDIASRNGVILVKAG